MKIHPVRDAHRLAADYAAACWSLASELAARLARRWARQATEARASDAESARTALRWIASVAHEHAIAVPETVHRILKKD